MTDDMDRLIEAVATDEVVRLTGMESAVWARVDARRDRARLGRMRVVAVAIALAIGVTNGGLMLLTPRPEPSEMRIFTVSAGLTPLSALEARR